MTPHSLQAHVRATSGPMRALCLLLVAAFVFGGGARADLQSLVILRPLAILLLFYGLARLDSAAISNNRPLLAFTAVSLLGIAAYLVPLPPQVWTALPGRELVRDIDSALGLGNIWRPLSLTPDATWNALYACLVPAAALVLGIQLDHRERGQLLWPVAVLGGLSAILAIAQLSGPANSALYFYAVTNDGAAVGLFANRNHQALLLALLLPVLAVMAAGREARAGLPPVKALVAVLAGLAVLLLILVTGSRGGLVLAALALASLPFVLGIPIADLARRRTVMIAGAAAAAAAVLVAVLAWQGRGLTWQRLFASAPGDDTRFAILPPLLGVIRTYLPLGSGPGSFERVFQLHEPDALLQPNYANHAHNDWLELALAGGIPAMALLLVAVIGFLVCSKPIMQRGIGNSTQLRLARLGWVAIVLHAAASLWDYPLRVPSLACIFVVGVIWMSCPLPKNPPSGSAS